MPYYSGYSIYSKVSVEFLWSIMPDGYSSIGIHGWSGAIYFLK